MRARNVKPSLFKNEFLATSDPLNTIIFEGLWCMADKEGRLEDRPRKIHLEINAGRAYEGTEAALAWLAEQGFILRYAHGADRYIQVVNFHKHQNPHPREAESVIPAPGLAIDATPRQDQGNALALSSPALSPSLIPSSLIPESSLFEREPVAGLDLQAWNRWEAYKRAIRKPIKPASLLAAQRKLAGFGSDQAAVVEHSVANGYTGLWEPRREKGNGSKLTWKPPPDEPEAASAQ
jgi:hypothetical protein